MKVSPTSKDHYSVASKIDIAAIKCVFLKNKRYKKEILKDISMIMIEKSK